MKRIKSFLKAVLFKLPGGQWFYHRIYLPLVLPNPSQMIITSPLPANPNQDLVVTKDKMYQAILDQDLALQEEWTLLLKEILSHLNFLEQFLQGGTSNPQEASQRIEEYYRHQKTLILTFEALLARQEAQISWLRTILVGPHPQDTDRVQRLEKVIEYLVEIAGEPYARRHHWEHQ